MSVKSAGMDPMSRLHSWSPLITKTSVHSDQGNNVGIRVRLATGETDEDDSDCCHDVTENNSKFDPLLNHKHKNGIQILMEDSLFGCLS